MGKPHGQTTISKVLLCLAFVLIQFLANFDASAIDGLVPLLELSFNINDAATATIRTSSSIAHTVTLGLLWVFGDVFERRKLLVASIFMWIVFSFLSMLLGSEAFMVFVLFRSLGFACTALFGVIMPVLMADVFQDRALGVVFMLMAGSKIVASQVTGILSSWIVSSGISWQLGVLVGPLLTILPLLIIVCLWKTFGKQPHSGENRSLERSLKHAFGILSVKSYAFLTASSSLGGFHLTSYRFWFPTMVLTAWTESPESFLGLSYTAVTTLSSFIKVAAMLIGLPLFLWLAQSWRYGTGPFSGRKGFTRAYPVVVSIGAWVNAVMYIPAFLLLEYNFMAHLVALFLVGFGQAADNSLSMQMIIMVVPSNSRASAMALSQLLSSIVGIPSAQLIGMISDAVRGDSTLDSDRFRSYQVALICSTLFAFASSICDLCIIPYFPGDCLRAEEKDKEEDESSEERTPLIEKTPLLEVEK